MNLEETRRLAEQAIGSPESYPTLYLASIVLELADEAERLESEVASWRILGRYALLCLESPWARHDTAIEDLRKALSLPEDEA